MDMRFTLPNYVLLLLFVTTAFIGYGQKRYTISGTVSEANSNETLIGASIIVLGQNMGVTTNAYGFYSLNLPEGEYQLQVSYIGFKNNFKTVTLSQNSKIDFQLTEEAEALDEVVVSENVEKLNLKTPQMSVNGLTAETIKKIPVLLGEADIIKSLLLLPGVTNAGEGASGFNVRGGAVDQNLILLDEAIIFNSSHLFGLFSVFNPDAIKDIKLYKGGIPARYGGRVSSVLDIFQKEGNSKTLKVNGGIGAVASRLLVEGPLIKDKAAFLIGGRSSYAHLFLPLFNIDNRAYFYDLNAKLNYKINQNNNVFLSGYFGRDVFSINDSFVNRYGNTVLNFRWNHLFSEQLFSNLSLIYSDYLYGLKLDFVGFNWESGIKTYNLKYDLKHYINDKLQVNYGFNNVYYQFNPGKIEPSNPDSGILEDQLAKKFANETAVYVDVEHELMPNLRLGYGLRFSNFVRFGQEELNVYENNNPVFFDPFLGIYQEANPIEVLNPGRWANLANFNNLEPRISMSYSANENNSWKASYTRLAQYLHLLSNTNSPTPLDVWTPSGPFIKPQLLDQYALGYFKDIEDGSFSLETEIYYKDIQNRIDFIDGANLIANDAIEQVILNGEARAYGWELLLRKNEGKFQGWLSYTLSKSEQRTPGRTDIETGINLGQWYNTPYDKTHDVAIFANWDINKKWSINSNFVYQTGQPTNFPVGQFDFQGITTPFFGLRNQQRLPDFHRIDVSASLKPDKNKNRKIQAEWVFSIYNLYGRKNAASINFRRNQETGSNEALRTSVFGIVPAVTYNFKF